MTKPLVERLRALSPAAREMLFATLGSELADIRYDFEACWARDDQLISPEELERYRLVVFGGPRGVGKTHSAVWLFFREIYAGRATKPRIVVGTEGDITETILYGESGVYEILPPEWHPEWIKSEGHAGVLVCKNGVRVTFLTAGGGQEQSVGGNSDWDLYDDVAKWGPRTETMWNHCRASCRIGRGIGIVATTRRGAYILRKLLKPGEMPRVLLRQPTDPLANANNLVAGHHEQMKAELGEDFFAQEMNDEEITQQSPFAGLSLEEAPIRISEAPRADLAELVVAVDPAEGKGAGHDEWGIGVAGRRHDRHVVALEDASGSYDDDEAANAALDLCERWGVSKIVVEQNRGPRVLNALKAAYYKRELEAARAGTRARPMPELVPVTARDGKRMRAGPLRGLYLQGMLHHVAGLGKLEQQQRTWDPDGVKRPKSDDRIDWLVHAVHHLADLADVTPDYARQLDGLPERVAAIRAKMESRTSAGLIQGSKNLSSLDPRSPSFRARAGTWGVGGGRSLL